MLEIEDNPVKKTRNEESHKAPPVPRSTSASPVPNLKRERNSLLADFLKRRLDHSRDEDEDLEIFLNLNKILECEVLGEEDEDLENEQLSERNKGKNTDENVALELYRIKSLLKQPPKDEITKQELSTPLLREDIESDIEEDQIKNRPNYLPRKRILQVEDKWGENSEFFDADGMTMKDELKTVKEMSDAYFKEIAMEKARSASGDDGERDSLKSAPEDEEVMEGIGYESQNHVPEEEEFLSVIDLPSQYNFSKAEDGKS